MRLINQYITVISFIAPLVIYTMIFWGCHHEETMKFSFHVGTDSLILKNFTGGVGSVKFLEQGDSVFVFMLNSAGDKFCRVSYTPYLTTDISVVSIPTQLRENKVAGIQQARSILPISTDSIMFAQKTDDYGFIFSLYVMSTGTIQPIYISKPENRIFFQELPEDGINWKYDKKLRKIIVAIVRQDDYDVRPYPIGTEALAGIDIATGEFEILPLKYPVNYEEKYQSNISRSEYFCLNDSLVVLTFAMHDTAFIYNTTTGICSKKCMASKSDRQFLTISQDDYENCETEKLRDANLRSFKYRSVFYDPYRKMYFRFYEQFMPAKNNDGLFNIWSDKQIGFACFDQEFNYIGEDCFGKMGDADVMFIATGQPVRRGMLLFLNYNQTQGSVTANNLLRLMLIQVETN
ncbi:MAG TPA: DUF4221 family protein [Bacteroidales bacterium]|nr:DUF4221 family protein [Bacteroidales bacterium]